MNKILKKTFSEVNKKLVPQSDINKFKNKIFYLNHILGGVAFLSGIKLCDYFFYEEKKLMKIKENAEKDYWEIYGEPKNIEPDFYPCFSDPKKTCKSYILIKYPKDKYVPKIDPHELRKLNK